MLIVVAVAVGIIAMFNMKVATGLAVVVLLCVGVHAVLKGKEKIVNNDENSKIGGFNEKQQRQKDENLKKIFEMVQGKGTITNNEVEKELGVSNATAERYLNELEKEGKLQQIGETGQSVIYKIR